MPSEMTSTPAFFFSWTLRSISANRYGGIRPRRLAPAGLVVLNVVEDSGQRIGLDLEPTDSWIAFPPTQLAPRVAPVGHGHHVRQLIQRDLAENVRERLRVADAGEHRRGRGHTGVERGLCFGHESPIHLGAASVDEPAVDDLEWRRQSNPRDRPTRRCTTAQPAQWWADRLEHLDRANHTHGVAQIDARIRIEREQARAQLNCVELLELRAKRPVRRY